ncbi:MAG: DUF4038 domain-containing protein [Anaerolineae bacterium]
MQIPRYGIFEASLVQTTRADNPYVEIWAEVQLTEPDGKTFRKIPLFWDDGRTWRFRFSPDKLGTWTWRTRSIDAGLDSASGTFEVVDSGRAGSLRPMTGHPYHFERQDGSRFWFLGETAWSLFVDSAEQQHDRAAALHHIDVRAAQGFNAFHSMLMSELGWGNSGGDPFHEIESERINPAYWQEVDHRLAYLNAKGVIGGLVLAWGRKRWDESEPFAWDRFPDLAAKLRYARYIAARYSAYDVYFIVAGEWNASAREPKRARGAPVRDLNGVRQEYIEIGDALSKSDPHGRMVGIHPGTGGFHFAREFNDAATWMSFGDYQQNYTDLNAGARTSRQFDKPVVNGEYAYYLRDADHDSKVDKPNSQTLAAIRHATWDILMAGAYVVSGFGSTYLGGARNVGPFDVDAPQNDDWEAQIQHLASFFRSAAYWRLEPHNELLSADVERSEDRGDPRFEDRLINGRPAPPLCAYWCLAEPGSQYVVYVRGTTEPITLDLASVNAPLTAQQFNPRTGAWKDLAPHTPGEAFVYTPPDAEDWIVQLG